MNVSQFSNKLLVLLCGFVAFLGVPIARLWLAGVLAGVLVLTATAPLALAATSELEESYYQELHEQYVVLSRRDPNVVERAQWDELIGETNAFFARGLTDEFAPKTAFLLARIHEHIFRRHQEPATLAAALEWSGRLVQEFPDSSLADDALLTLGDLERHGRNDESAALKAYRRIVEEYPNSDTFVKAMQRIGESSDVPRSERKRKKKKGLFSRIFSSGDAAEERAAGLSRTDDDQAGVDSSRDATTADATSAQPNYETHPIVKRLPRIPVIVIDPGHGGEEEGAHGVEGLLEKEVVLQISLLLEEMLRKRIGAKIVLTRVRDVKVELAERTQIANQHNADLFISVHANASPARRLSGIETYYLDNTDDKSSLRLAERENASSQTKLSDLGFMISDLIQNAKLDDSISLAHYLQNALYKKISAEYPDVRNLGVKKAPFFVLVGAHMPCVLTEVSFIDHKTEGPRLATREYQKLVAEALFDGVVNYLEHRWISMETDGKR